MGAPPPMGGATGPASAPGPLAGSASQGMAKLKIGLEALQAALPMLPMGGELHTDVMKAVSSLTKHLGDKGNDPGAGIQQLLEMLRNAKQGGAPPQAAMMPGGPPPGGAPPAPPMGAPPPMGA